MKYRARHAPATEPRIWASVVRGLELPLIEQSLDPDRLYAECGIARADLQKVQGSIPLKKYLSLLEVAARAANDPLLGIRLAQSTGPEALGAIGFLFLSSRNLFEAIDNMCTYINLLQDSTHIQFLKNQTEISFSYQLLHASEVDSRQDVEFSLALVCKLARIYTRQKVEFTAVNFRHSAVAPKADYRRLLNAPAYFEQESNCVQLPASAGQIEGAVPDHGLSRILKEFLDEQLDRRSRMRTFSDQVSDALFSNTIAPPATAKKIASHLGVSEATLHRRLRADRTSLGEIVDSRNYEIAMKYLGESNISITQIAQLVGFAESASFTRAFKRWAGGLTPSAYRKRALSRQKRILPGHRAEGIARK